MERVVISGNVAQSYAARLAKVQVVAAYPITPQTTIVEKLADFVADGSLKARYVRVESEHSALQTCVSASALGFINEDSVQDETYSNYKLMPEALSQLESR